MKFTFKTERPTGRFAFVHPTQYYVKLKKQTIGSIDDELPHQISLMVIKSDIMEDGNPNCKWRWIRLKHHFTSVDEAKKFLNDNFEAINNKWKLAIDKD